MPLPMKTDDASLSVRFVPPSIDYAKRTARYLQRLLELHVNEGVKLHVAQRTVARAYRFNDWFSLDSWLKRDGAKSSLLDAHCTEREVQMRRRWTTEAIIEATGLPIEIAEKLSAQASLTGAPQARPKIAP